ncbi:MAG: type II toxin-antitoxin system Phd/YefM family antitoxin [Acidobacteriota bacterium]
MKEISIQELQHDTGQLVRLAARRERIIITDGGQPVAALMAFKCAPRATIRLPGGRIGLLLHTHLVRGGSLML